MLFRSCAKTLEECRLELEQVVEDWILYSIANKLPIRPLDGLTIKVPELLPQAS